MIIAEDSLQLNPDVRTAVTVGKFDGLHRGHRLLIDRIVSEQANGLLPVVVSVEDRREKARLLSPEETAEMLSSFGVGAYLRMYLDPEIRDLSPSAFIRRFLVRMLHTSVIALGNDFTFGKGRAGNYRDLKKAGDSFGFTAVVFDRITEEGEVISSASIREAIREGSVLKASKMLGYPYGFSVGLSEELLRKEEQVFLPFPAGRVVPGPGRYRILLKDQERCTETEAVVTEAGSDASSAVSGAWVRAEDIEGEERGSALELRFLDFLGT